MMTIVLVVVIATIFLLGLLAGERWLSRQLKRRERQLAAVRHEVHQLARDRTRAVGFAGVTDRRLEAFETS